MSNPALKNAVAGLQGLSRLRSSCALAEATLWHTDAPGTSQLTSVQQALALGLLSALILGGNRSGKTEAGAMLAVAFALGRDHPAVISWGRRNNLDLSVIQEGPGRVCASALSSGDSREYLRPKVEKYLPAGTVWSNRHGNGPASARLPGGGVILFKSNDQKARAYQGAAWHLLWLDEEHDASVFSEARMRLADHAGLALFTMTPLKGKTWVYKLFVDPTTKEEDSSFYAINSFDNPHRAPGFLEKLLSKYGAHERAARERGEFTALEGRVYEDWRQDLHVVSSFPVPLGWPRFQVWDMGVRNPTCVLWAAVDRSDQIVHIYREHYQAGLTTHQNAKKVLDIELCPTCSGAWYQTESTALNATWAALDASEYHRLPRRKRKHRGDIYVCPTCWDTVHPGRTEPEPDVRWIDPAAADSRLTLQNHHDLDMRAARNPVREGISAVASLLAPDAAGRTHLLIHDCCINTIDEFGGYLWDTTNSKGDAPDRPLKKNDHAMDCIKYLCLGLQDEGEITIFDAP